MEADQLRRSPNPNICASCEQLLADDSPSVMANIAQLEPHGEMDELLDKPLRIPSVTADTAPAPPPSETKQSKK